MGSLHDPTRDRDVFPTTLRRRPVPHGVAWTTGRSAWLAGVVVLVASGCDGCHRSKPYTPYTLAADSAASTGAPPVDASAPVLHADAGGFEADGGLPPFAIVNGVAAPGDGSVWPLDGGATARAPGGRAFGLGLVVDVDGDGKRDLIAWAHAPDGLRGELWFASGSNPDDGRTVAALPGDLSIQGCTALTQLALVGPGTVAFQFDPRCPAARERATLWLAVVRLRGAKGAAPEIALEMRARAPADGEAIQLAVDARDRDGDGHDDMAVRVGVAGAPQPFHAAGGAQAAASALLVYLDRPAGLSRDPSEPEASLRAAAAALVVDGRKKVSAPRVAPGAVALRRLHELLCEDAGGASHGADGAGAGPVGAPASRYPVVISGAGPIHCGEPRFLEDAAVAEVEAALNLSDPVAAFAAVDRLSALGVRRKDVDTLVAKSVPSVTAGVVHRVAAIPRVDASPAYGPLAFEAGGDLLVRAKDGVVRVEHDSFEESPVDAAQALWSARLGWPADAPAWKLAGIEARCDRPTPSARFESTGTAGAAGSFDRPLPILTPSRCSPDMRLPAALLGPTAQGELVAVGAELFVVTFDASPKVAPADAIGAPAGAVVPLGASRSPDGATVAISTSRGVLVATPKPKGGASARLWTGIDGASLCAPSDGATRLACVRGEAAAIFEAK